MQLQRQKACCVLLARLGHEMAHSGVSRPTCSLILALPFPCSVILLHSLMSSEPSFPYLQTGRTRRRSQSWSLLQELRELIDELLRSRLYPQRTGHISGGSLHLRTKQLTSRREKDVPCRGHQLKRLLLQYDSSSS